MRGAFREDSTVRDDFLRLIGMPSLPRLGRAAPSSISMGTVEREAKEARERVDEELRDEAAHARASIHEALQGVAARSRASQAPAQTGERSVR